MSTTIFLADDHGIVRQGMRLILEMDPRFKIIGESDDGRDAVHKMSELIPDIAILDISMPFLNGIEATRQICLLHPEINVLILSMYSDRQHVTQALSAGARGYLLKTSLSSDLVQAVETVRLGHRYLSQKIEDLVVDDYLDLVKASEEADPLSILSPREREVVQLIVEGYPSAEIARVLSLATSTVDTYRARIMQKLQITTLSELIKFAIQNGLIQL